MEPEGLNFCSVRSMSCDCPVTLTGGIWDCRLVLLNIVNALTKWRES